MKIEWNKVTRLSQFVAIVLFIAVYFYGFYVGRQVGIAKTFGSVVSNVVFTCDGNKSIHTVFYERGVKVGFPNEPESFLLQTISASGARYANVDESLVFWNKGNEALIMRNNQMDLNFTNCKTGNTELLQYSNTTYNISFSYPSAYSLTETNVAGATSHHQIILTPKADLPLPVNGEGPTTITIDLYQNNTNKFTTDGWIRNSKESNLKLGDGTVSATTISGMPAESFRWSGLYEGTTIALAKPDWVYVFSVTYPEMGAPIVQDFVKVRDSVKI